MYLDAVSTGLSIWSIYGDVDYAVPNTTGTVYTIYDSENNAYSYSPATSSKKAEYFKNGELLENFSFTNIGQSGFENYFTKNADSTYSKILVSSLSLSVEDKQNKYTLNRKIDDTQKQAYTCNGADLANTMYGPDIEIAEEGNYIIDGYYTEFKFKTSMSLTQHVTNDKYLVLGGELTDYQITDITPATGGTVTKLETNNLIFLIMLCAVAGPLMRLLQNSVPWILKQSRALKKFLTKLQ